MILIIDNYDSFTYNLYQVIALFYEKIKIIRNNKITLDEIKQLNPVGIVLSPGPGRPENAGICVRLIQALLAGNLPQIPLLGVCLGHQALTIALGGRVVQADHIAHGKSDEVYHCQTGIYQTLPSPFVAGRYHSLMAERETLPSSLIVEAENKNHVIMGMRHHALPLYGVQFHPESILTSDGKALLREFVKICVR